MTECQICNHAKEYGWWGVPGTHCDRCHRQWRGLKEIHCQKCCQHFSTVDNLEAHRIDGQCTKAPAFEGLGFHQNEAGTWKRN